jgi:hypothetical protein
MILLRSLVCSLIASAVLAVNSAHAQSTPPVSDAAAEANAAIERGIVARQRGDDEALQLFRRANALVPTARAQAQIALAEQALGQWVAAERDLTAALQLTADPWIQRNETVLRTALGQIQERLATIELRVATENAEVRINEEVVGQASTGTFRVPSGTVTIKVRAQGFISQRRTIEVAPRARWREVFNLVRSDASSANQNPGDSNTGVSNSSAGGATSNSRGPQPPLPRASFAIAPVVVGGVGVATLALSGVFAALRGQAQGSCPLDTGSNALVCTSQASYDAALQGRTWTTATNVTLIAGSIVIVGAGVWLAVSLATAPRAERTALRRVIVAPSIAANQAGLTIGGSL